MNDYTLNDIIGTEKDFTPVESPLDWLVPGSAASKEKKPDLPPGYDPGVASPDDPHMKAGKQLEKFGVKLRETDSDGLKPGKHGSAWIAAADDMEKIVDGLYGLGYRPKGQGRFVRGPLMVEMGKTPEKLYIYITDDNIKGGKRVIPGGMGKTKERVMKVEAGEDHPAKHYLVVENPYKPTTWHLRVYDVDGKIDHKLMGAAWAALHADKGLS